MLISSPRTRRHKIHEPPILLGAVLLMSFFWLQPRMATNPAMAILAVAAWVLQLARMLWLPWKLRIADRVEERTGRLWIKGGITVSDVALALSFYRDILGLTFLFAPSSTLAVLQAGDTRVMLSTPQGSGAVDANSILYFCTNDIEATHSSLVNTGAKNERAPRLAARMPDHDLWLGFMRDPDGNLEGLMEEKVST